MTLASYQLILEVAFFECYVITHAFIGFYGDFRGNRLNIGLVTVILQFLSKLRNFVPFSFFTNFLRILHMIFSNRARLLITFSLLRTVTISLDERSHFLSTNDHNFPFTHSVISSRKNPRQYCYLNTSPRLWRALPPNMKLQNQPIKLCTL